MLEIVPFDLPHLYSGASELQDTMGSHLSVRNREVSVIHCVESAPGTLSSHRMPLVESLGAP